MIRTAILILTLSFVVAAAPAADENWEQLPDGSMGREAEFRGVDGVAIAAYIRKPAGPGPFPVIVWMHGGKDSRQATIFNLRRKRAVNPYASRKREAAMAPPRGVPDLKWTTASEYGE